MILGRDAVCSGRILPTFRRTACSAKRRLASQQTTQWRKSLRFHKNPINLRCEANSEETPIMFICRNSLRGNMLTSSACKRPVSLYSLPRKFVSRLGTILRPENFLIRHENCQGPQWTLCEPLLQRHLAHKYRRTPE
jgi:hypothetical protein